MFGRKARSSSPPATQAPPARVITVYRLNPSKYTARCFFGRECPLAPPNLPWVAMKPRRQEAVEALYVHLHRVHGIAVAEIEQLPIEDK